VLTLYVREGYRNRRIGSRVLREIIEISRKKGFNFIIVTTDSDNIPALRLYNRYRFRKVLCLRKSDLTVLMLPLTLVGNLTYRVLRVICSILSDELLEYLHETLGKTTKKRLW
jgi:RimJ/RimL family protein N-acetyltransferase